MEEKECLASETSLCRLRLRALQKASLKRDLALPRPAKSTIVEQSCRIIRECLLRGTKR